MPDTTTTEVPADLPESPDIPWQAIGEGSSAGLIATALIALLGRAHRLGILKSLLDGTTPEDIQEKVRDRFRAGAMLVGTRFEASSRGRPISVEVVQPELPPASEMEVQPVDVKEEVPNPETFDLNPAEGLIQIEPTTAIAIKDTWLKRRLLQSGELENSEKWKLRQGDSLTAIAYKEADDGRHFQIELVQAGTGLWWVYQPDFKFEEEPVVDDGTIILPVPYYYQNDNNPSFHGPGNRQCCLTSNAALLSFLLKEKLEKLAKSAGFSQPEDYYGSILIRHGDSTSHTANTHALATFKVESHWSTRLSMDDIKKSLRLKVPVVIAVAYRRSGHVLIVVGDNPEKEGFIVNDSYGIRHGAKSVYTIGPIGERDFYSYELMEEIWCPNAEKLGWGRVVTQIQGRSTSLG